MMHVERSILFIISEVPELSTPSICQNERIMSRTREAIK